MRYLLAYVVTGPAGSAIDGLRREIERRFDVHGAMRLPPHITLVPPFVAADQAALMTRIEAALVGARPFTVGVTGFGYFNESVCFIGVEQPREIFAIKEALEKGIAEVITPNGRPQRETHFHLTLAYKDVTPPTFRQIKAFLEAEKPPVAGLTVDNVTLLQHDGGVWVPVKTFVLQ